MCNIGDMFVKQNAIHSFKKTQTYKAKFLDLKNFTFKNKL